MRAEVAEQAVAAGAVLVNDVSGGLADPRMLAAVAALGSPYVVMHWRGPSAGMQAQAHYDDVVAEVCAELADRVAACRAAGISELVVDPGLGFAKDADAQLGAAPAAAAAGRAGPAAVRRLPQALPRRAARRARAEGRDAATTAITTLAAQQGVWGVRVHDVAGSADAVRVVERLSHDAGCRRSSRPTPGSTPRSRPATST